MAFGLLANLADKVLGRFFTNKDKSNEAQTQINQAEIAGGPVSYLRLWRSFLGWGLAVAFMYVVIVFPVVKHYWPEANLPEITSLQEIITPILMAMLGFG